MSVNIFFIKIFFQKLDEIYSDMWYNILTMNRLMNKYKISLQNTPKPIMPSQLANTKLDLKGLMAYAKNKNISPSMLSEKEKAQFIMWEIE